MISDFDHYTVRNVDHKASWRFYESALGLTVREREGSPVPAFKVSIGEREVAQRFPGYAGDGVDLRQAASRRGATSLEHRTFTILNFGRRA